MQDPVCFSNCYPSLEGEDCFLVRSDMRQFILGEESWLAFQGQAEVGILSLYFTPWPNHRTSEAGEEFR